MRETINIKQAIATLNEIEGLADDDDLDYGLPSIEDCEKSFVNWINSNSSDDELNDLSYIEWLIYRFQPRNSNELKSSRLRQGNDPLEFRRLLKGAIDEAVKIAVDEANRKAQSDFYLLQD